MPVKRDRRKFRHSHLNGWETKAFMGRVKRELIILLYAMSRTTEQIAAQLHTSPKTILYHRLIMRDSMALHDIAAMTRYAYKHKLI